MNSHKTDPTQGTPPYSYPILKLIILVVVLASIVEGGMRLRQLVKYGSAHPGLYRSMLDPVSGLKVPVPGQKTLHMTINSLGFRGPDIPAEKPAGTIRLAFLGESNTFSAETTSDQETWPDLVCRYLQRRWSQSRFDYVNAAFPGYTVANSMRALEYRVKPLHPDIIFVNQASTDLYVDTRELALKTGVPADEVPQQMKLEKYSVAFGLAVRNYQIWLRLHRAKSGRRTLQVAPEVLSEGFHRRLAVLVQQAKKAAPVVVLVTYPYKARWSQPPAIRWDNVKTSLFYASWMSPDGFLHAIDEYNRIIRLVAQEEGVPLVDAAEAIPGDSIHFQDSVHYKDAGSEVMAAKVEEVLARTPAIQQLVTAEHPQLARIGSK